jgi:uncharacterized repeat protein (TIGR01451 family)
MSTPSVPLRVSLVNGSFEAPVVSGYEILPDASQPQARKFVPGWRTTATDHMIEIWRTGFSGVPSTDGQQFAELNANQVSTLYQDLPTTPGTKLYWRLFHRGRQGRDTMALDIGPVNAPVEQGRFTDGNTAWGRYSGTYVVPAGQSVTRFAFRSISAAGGNQGIGNFLDGIFFGTAPAVTLTKIAVPQGPLDVGDVLTYRITARNEGGGAAENLVLTDVLPEHTTYVPGSLRIVDGPGAGAKTDARGDDQAYYDAGTRTVYYHLGAGANATTGGSLANTADLPGGSTIEYRVRIGLAAAGARLVNTASATYENRLGDRPEPLTATSNETATEVNPAADLSVVKSADLTTVTVGQTVVHRLTVHNAGPSRATGVVVADRLPAGLAFLSAESSQGGFDPVAGRWAVGDLAVGASATLVLRAKATRACRLTNTATVSGRELDPAPADNTDSVVVCVEPVPRCCNPCAPREGC